MNAAAAYKTEIDRLKDLNDLITERQLSDPSVQTYSMRLGDWQLYTLLEEINYQVLLAECSGFESKTGSCSVEGHVLRTAHKRMTILKGSIKVTVEGEVFNLGTGDTMLVQPNIEHSWISNTDAKVILICIPPEKAFSVKGK